MRNDVDKLRRFDVTKKLSQKSAVHGWKEVST